MSGYIEEAAYAKINLTLAVTGRRADGYHNIRSVMQTVDLCDRVRLRPLSGGIALRLSDLSLPTDRRNTAYAAAKAVLGRKDCPLQGIEITIDKHIPQQAGLAGGSADAAAVLRGLNRLCGYRWDKETLCGIGRTIGADVPFCVCGGAALATGIGDELTPVTPLKHVWIVLVKPPVGVSTAEAYAAVDGAPRDERAEVAAEKRLLDALRLGQPSEVGAALFNEFETALSLPEVRAVRRRLEACAPLGVCMTGSGSAVYALFENEQAARRAAETLTDAGETFVCCPTSA